MGYNNTSIYILYSPYAPCGYDILYIYVVFPNRGPPMGYNNNTSIYMLYSLTEDPPMGYNDTSIYILYSLTDSPMWLWYSVYLYVVFPNRGPPMGYDDRPPGPYGFGPPGPYGGPMSNSGPPPPWEARWDLCGANDIHKFQVWFGYGDNLVYILKFMPK